MFDPQHLAALSAAVAEGTFERAARRLDVTPSAVSQRIRALETAAGRVLLVRSKPIRPTESGAVVLRLARQTELLASETAAELGTADGPAALTIAVSADALATWVLPALAPLADGTTFRLLREDEDRTSALLRDGTAVAAVTADPEPVPGCTVRRLGRMRYRPAATAAFVERWFPDGPTAEALARAPVVTFDAEDRLQQRWLDRRAGPGVAPPAHCVPSTADFARAVRLGLGWGMLMDGQLEGPGAADPLDRARSSGSPDGAPPPERLVVLDPDGAVEVPLFWQQWRLRTPTLDRVADAVVTAAASVLTPP